MSSHIRDCPEQFYSNCSNAGVKCSICAAGAGKPDGKVLYSARDVLAGEQHPYSATAEQLRRDSKRTNKNRPIDKVKSRQIRRALRKEGELVNEIHQTVEKTLKSGAIYGDGDLKILGGLAHAEVKQRFNTRNFSVTWGEYQKGLRQGVSHWLITVTDPNGHDHTCVFMTVESYSQLLSQVVRHNDDN